ncbi:MAG: hypothetical protein HZA50_08395 [Planctomycetes bacterium]|nr:hypothetical protein [Planctomycetota bacterium]
MKAEISFDLIMEENMSFVEGTYRLLGGDWQVFIFSRSPTSQPEIDTTVKWKSGATGVRVIFPKSKKLNKSVVIKVLSQSFGVTEWQEVHGPDSMQLR